MAKRLDPRLATVTVVVKSVSGEKLEDIQASAAHIRNGRICLQPLKLKKETAVFFLQMPPGKHRLFVSAPDFDQEALFVEFIKEVHPTVTVTLQATHSPKFLPFEQLSSRVREIFDRSGGKQGLSSGNKLYNDLGHVKKATALNILAKMAATPVAANAGETVADSVDCIYRFRPDRIYAVLKRNLALEIDVAIKQGESFFRPVPGTLHKEFPSGSYKTAEEGQAGNLQLTFDSRKAKQVKVDADIDIYADVFRHLFGEVFWNHLTDVKTSPFQVYPKLREAGIEPEYSLEDGRDQG